MAKSRTKSDVLAQAGIGFPFPLVLFLTGAFVATTTNIDRFQIPLEMGVVTQGVRQGHAVSISQIQVFAQTPGDRTTGTYTFTLTKVDSAGNSLGTFATFTVAPAFPYTAVDLRDVVGNGLTLKPGEGLRLDTGAAATGGATSATNIRFRLIGEAYGIAA